MISNDYLYDIKRLRRPNDYITQYNLLSTLKHNYGGKDNFTIFDLKPKIFNSKSDPKAKGHLFMNETSFRVIFFLGSDNN